MAAGAPRSRRAQAIVAGVALVWLALVGYATMTPSPPHQAADKAANGLIDDLTGHRSFLNFRLGEAERFANVVLFVPLGLMGALLLPTRRWRAVVGCLLLSGLIETIQALWVTSRVASVHDVAENTAGGVIGWLLAAGWLALVARVMRQP